MHQQRGCRVTDSGALIPTWPSGLRDTVSKSIIYIICTCAISWCRVQAVLKWVGHFQRCMDFFTDNQALSSRNCNHTCHQPTSNQTKSPKSLPNKIGSQDFHYFHNKADHFLPWRLGILGMFGQQLAVVFPLQQHIFRFDVTMRQAMLMKVPQTTEDAVEDSWLGGHLVFFFKPTNLSPPKE